MRTLWLINPNTSDAITSKLERHVRQIAANDVDVLSFTARFGAPYIADEASYAVAGHATLDAWRHAKSQPLPSPQGVIIACFGDPGLYALREVADCPVTGLAEAACLAAARRGRFAIVTGGERWRPILLRLIQSLDLLSALSHLEIVTLDGAQLARDPVRARELLATACARIIAAHEVGSIVLGGAGLAGMAAELQPQVTVPLIDSVSAAALHLLK